MTVTKRATNPTKADIIVVLLAQAVADAQAKVRVTMADDRSSLREAVAARNALIDIKAKVDRYMAGDISVLIR